MQLTHRFFGRQLAAAEMALDSSATTELLQR